MENIEKIISYLFFKMTITYVITTKIYSSFESDFKQIFETLSTIIKSSTLNLFYSCRHK